MLRPVVRIRRQPSRGAVPYVVAGIAAFSPLALAHHGWAWAEEAQSTLTGQIESVSMAAPHPTLQVVDAEGTTWQVDLGNPNQTQRSGFTGETAGQGDAITVLGNRNRDRDRHHMKAVRITIDGKNYDLYPERITGGG